MGGNPIDIDGPAGYLAFRDALFRKHRKSGWVIRPLIEPRLEEPLADTHAHLDMLSDVPLTLARCAVLGVDFICSIADPSEEDGGRIAYRDLDIWRGEALRILPEVYDATRAALAAWHEQDGASGAAAGNGPDAGNGPRDGGGMTAADWLANRRPCEQVRIPRVRLAAGVHPHNASRWDASMESALRALLADPRTAALGEVGLDYHYDLSPRDVQRDVFRRQIAIAHECGLPLVLHVREAHGDAFDILEQEGWPAAGTLLHCCSVGPDELARWIGRGVYVAFGGAVTFQRSDDLRASAAIVPEDRLLTETDSPYMAPVPFRGLECGPEFTLYTAARIAEVRGRAAGERRRTLLADMHATALALLDREPTAWQRAQAAEAATGGIG